MRNFPVDPIRHTEHLAEAGIEPCSEAGTRPRHTRAQAELAAQPIEVVGLFRRLGGTVCVIVLDNLREGVLTNWRVRAMMGIRAFALLDCEHSPTEIARAITSEVEVEPQSR